MLRARDSKHIQRVSRSVRSFQHYATVSFILKVFFTPCNRQVFFFPSIIFFITSRFLFFAVLRGEEKKKERRNGSSSLIGLLVLVQAKKQGTMKMNRNIRALSFPLPTVFSSPEESRSVCFALESTGSKLFFKCSRENVSGRRIMRTYCKRNRAFVPCFRIVHMHKV